MSSHEMHTVCAADGTLIAYQRLGSGPALVFVDGAFCTASMGPGNTLSPPLSELFTTVVYDRRGRGHSGDAPSYAPEREVEDLAAVIDAVGGSAYVFGHSSGAVLALEGAQAGLPIAGMVLYEPPMVLDDSRLPVPTDLPARIAELAEEGRGRAVVRKFMTEAIRVPKPLALAMSVLPGSGRLGAIAHTVRVRRDRYESLSKGIAVARGAVRLPSDARPCIGRLQEPRLAPDGRDCRRGRDPREPTDTSRRPASHGQGQGDRADRCRVPDCPPNGAGCAPFAWSGLMRRVVVSEFVTLDGVFEDPGGVEGFRHGGWAFGYDRGSEGDRFKLEEILEAEALLLGRVTYEGFAETWPSRGDGSGFADKMNSISKFVASTTLSHGDWNNSNVISGDLNDEVRRNCQ